MPADHLLNTLLQRYQDVHDRAETDRIVATTAHLLARLTNPLNLGILTSQLLIAPAIWHRHENGPRLALRIVGLYNTAASRVREKHQTDARNGAPALGSRSLGCDEWARAVIKGADERSRSWKHVLVIIGVFLGMHSQGRPSISWGLKEKLEQAIITATNIALGQSANDGALASEALVTALVFVFPLISEGAASRLNCGALLPMAMFVLTGEHGFDDGHFLDDISQDTTEDSSHRLQWLTSAPSYRGLQVLEEQPIVANVGPLSKLLSFAAQHARDSVAVLQAHDVLLLFTSRLLDAWTKTGLSDIDPDLEATRLAPETLQMSWPLLWQVMRKLLFGSVAVLQAIISRSLLGPNLLVHRTAPSIATKSLHILRNLTFISSRNGNNAFQVYTFTFLTSIDVLSRDPTACEHFLKEIRDPSTMPFPASYLQRTLHLFHLNVAEHLPLALSTASCQAHIVEPAQAYVGHHDGQPLSSSTELFESAHSAILSVLACPQHSLITVDIAPFYVVKLFESFPHRISPRQFRVAFKTIMEAVSPPSPISAWRPELSETLLEMLRCDMPTASTALLGSRDEKGAPEHQELPLSQQSGYVIALVDSLPFLPLALVEEWLGFTAQAIREIKDPFLREPVKQRFLDVLVNGEMDVERSMIGVAWWGTKGGREAFLGSPDQTAMMSGAAGVARTSRL